MVSEIETIKAMLHTIEERLADMAAASQLTALNPAIEHTKRAQYFLVHVQIALEKK